MTFHLAQLNIARFVLPKEHAANQGFIDNLDRVNAIAETQAGFVWRLVGDDNSATDIDAYDDEMTIVNLSVWQDVESLSAFVYRNKEHREIMRRRSEWFHNTQIHLVLWWVPAGHLPSVSEATHKLALLEQSGPTSEAFTFKETYPPKN